MSDTKNHGLSQHEPLWGSWYIDSFLGSGAFGSVYKIRQEDFGQTYYSALKVVSIPQRDTEIREMQSEGLDEHSMRDFFYAFVKDIISEVTMMREFRGNSNIVSFEDHKIIEKKDTIGWDILIRMELLTSLSDHAEQTPLSTEETVKLGIHICRALELCAQKNTVHRDIKPENIFLSPYGEYKLGDFGIARHVEQTMSGLSKKGTYTYMAPEVFRGEPYSASVDIYSLGIVMYRMLNRNRTPFLPDFPLPIMPSDRDNALQWRMGGSSVPPIKGISPELNSIILKACAFNRLERFETPTEMRTALEALAKQSPPQQAPDFAASEATACLPANDYAVYDSTACLSSNPSETHLNTAGQGSIPHPSNVTHPTNTPYQTNVPHSTNVPYPTNAPHPANMSYSANMPYTDTMPHTASVTHPANIPSAAYTPSSMGTPPKKSKTKLIAALSSLAAALLITGVLLAVFVINPKNDDKDDPDDPKPTIRYGQGNELYLSYYDEKVSDERLVSMVFTGEIPINVKSLAFYGSQISDLTPLSSFIDLEYLYLSNGTVTDLTPLEPLTKLKVLDLSKNSSVTDLKPLKSLTNLTSLDLNGTSVSDITPLASLVSLTDLDLSSTGIKNYAPLTSLTKLRALSLNNNNISDLTIVEPLTWVKSIHLSNNKISSLTSLTSMTGLESLYLDKNTISDVAPLESLTRLKTLSLDNNNISNITPIHSLTGLERLSLNTNLISDLTPLESLVRLNNLSVNANQVQNITALKSLTFLESLSLSRNTITDIEPLKSLIRLKYLYISQLTAAQKEELEAVLTGCAIYSY